MWVPGVIEDTATLSAPCRTWPVIDGSVLEALSAAARFLRSSFAVGILGNLFVVVKT